MKSMHERYLWFISCRFFYGGTSAERHPDKWQRQQIRRAIQLMIFNEQIS